MATLNNLKLGPDSYCKTGSSRPYTRFLGVRLHARHEEDISSPFYNKKNEAAETGFIPKATQPIKDKTRIQLVQLEEREGRNQSKHHHFPCYMEDTPGNGLTQYGS